MMRRHIFARPTSYTFDWVEWVIVGLTTAFLCAIATGFWFVFLLVKPAGAHDAGKGWVYPLECCADHDCAQIDSERVGSDASGYVVDGHFHVQYSQVRNSPDGNYHACFPKPDVLRCLFVPPPSG
jgi:hypothetical protein